MLLGKNIFSQQIIDLVPYNLFAFILMLQMVREDPIWVTHLGSSDSGTSRGDPSRILSRFHSHLSLLASQCQAPLGLPQVARVSSDKG